MLLLYKESACDFGGQRSSWRPFRTGCTCRAVRRCDNCVLHFVAEKLSLVWPISQDHSSTLKLCHSTPSLSQHQNHQKENFLIKSKAILLPVFRSSLTQARTPSAGLCSSSHVYAILQDQCWAHWGKMMRCADALKVSLFKERKIKRWKD